MEATWGSCLWNRAVRHEGCTSLSIKQKLEENRVKKLAVQLDLQVIVQNKQTSHPVLSGEKSKKLNTTDHPHKTAHIIKERHKQKRAH